MSSENNGWEQWSKHVLTELKRLNYNYDSLRKGNEEIKAELNKLSNLEEGIVEIKRWKTKVDEDLNKIITIENNTEELKDWKKRIDEIASPSQLSQNVSDIESLKNFKTVAITVWAVIQFATGLALAIIGKLF
jgi:DNA repair exonuclease SbcCD ATPase subunit